MVAILSFFVKILKFIFLLIRNEIDKYFLIMVRRRFHFFVYFVDNLEWGLFFMLKWRCEERMTCYF